MDVAVTGATGLIGTALVASLRAEGHRVRPVVRGAAGGPDTVGWDPAPGTIDADGRAGVGAVVHLAGAGIGDHRWTEAYKSQVRDSRVRGTDLVARTVAELSPRPGVLVSASGVDYYGPSEEPRSESSPAG